MTFNYNATQKNLLFAAATGVVAATPAAPAADLALFAQPVVAATVFTKGRKLPARIAHAVLGAGLGFLGLGFGLVANPQYGNPEVAEAPAPVEEVVEAPAPTTPVQIIDANDTPWAAGPVDPATVAEAAPGNVDPGKPRVAPTTQPTDTRAACDYGRFYDNPCAHTAGADMVRTYQEARRFIDGHVTEVCFNGDYTKQYYSRTCALVWNGGEE